MSTKKIKREIFVFAHWKGLSETVIMGTLHSELLRGKEIFSFEYSEDLLRYEHLLSRSQCPYCSGK